jgi:hypothetical protein
MQSLPHDNVCAWVTVSGTAMAQRFAWSWEQVLATPMLAIVIAGAAFAQPPVPDARAGAALSRAQQERLRALEEQVRAQQERMRALEEQSKAGSAAEARVHEAEKRANAAVADAEAERKRAESIAEYANRRIAEEIAESQRSAREATVELERVRHDYQRDVGSLQKLVQANVERAAAAERERLAWGTLALLLGIAGGALGYRALLRQPDAEPVEPAEPDVHQLADLVDLPDDAPAASSMTNAGELDAAIAR